MTRIRLTTSTSRLDLGDHVAVHLVGAVGQAQGAGATQAIASGKSSVMPAAAVQLDGAVDDVRAMLGTSTFISLTAE